MGADSGREDLIHTMQNKHVLTIPQRCFKKKEATFTERYRVNNSGEGVELTTRATFNERRNQKKENH